MVRKMFMLAIVLFFAAGTVYGCGHFEQHIRDGIRLFQSRKFIYSELTGGKSDSIFREILIFQKLCLPVARIIDLRGRKWQKNGVPILAEDFVPVSNMPPFVEVSSTEPQPIEFFQKADGLAIRKNVLSAYKCGGLFAVTVVLKDAIKELEPFPTYHSMLRHMLESALRICRLAPKHDELANILGLKPTVKLSWYLVRFHTSFFGRSSNIDAKAAPIQALGIPIITQDVPPIHLASNFYD